jgi:small subunit ribosomal protein S17
MPKVLTGVVASDKVDKTIVVSITTRKSHPIYKKQYVQSKKVMAHDESNQAKLGDTVSIVETRPLSARKRYRLERVLTKAAIRHVEPEAAPVDETEQPKVEPKA